MRSSTALSRRHNVRQENKRPRDRTARQRLGGADSEGRTADQAAAKPEVLADDLLFGAEEIGNYIGRDPRWVYYKQKALGLTHCGALLVGSKRNLRRLLTGN